MDRGGDLSLVILSPLTFHAAGLSQLRWKQPQEGAVLVLTTCPPPPPRCGQFHLQTKAGREVGGAPHA